MRELRDSEMRRMHCPPGYLSKADAAQRLGVSVKTLDRRMRTEELLSNVMRKGRQVFLPIAALDAYFRLGQERGYI